MANPTATGRPRLPPEVEAQIAQVPPYLREEVRRKLEAQYANYKPPPTSQDILDMVTKGRAENKKTIGDLIGEGTGVLGSAGSKAIASETGALDDYGNYVNGLDFGHGPGYVGDLTSQAAGATADPRSINAQYDALDQLKSLTDPTVTAKEQYLKETARQQQERDQRSYRDAVLQNLGARGIRSGGAEIAALNGAQQETGNRRMLQDLGTNAGAVDRSLAALTGYGNLASGIRNQSFGEAFKTGSAADDVAKFSKQLKTDYDFRMADLADRHTMAKLGAQRDLTDKKIGSAADAYGYETAPLKYKTNLTEDLVTGNRADTGAQVHASEFGIGEQDKQKALDALQPKGLLDELFGGLF